MASATYIYIDNLIYIRSDLMMMMVLVMRMIKREVGIKQCILQSGMAFVSCIYIDNLFTLHLT